MKRKLLALFLVLSLIFVGCQKGGEQAKKSDKKHVTVTTTFINDMVKVLAKDYVDVEMIIPAGEDQHLYVARPDDYKKIKNADLLLYHGLHFEGKMNDILKEKGEAITKSFSESDIGKMEEDGKTEIDPHFWFDINLYKTAFTEVKDSLLKLLSDLPEKDKNMINENYEKYTKELDALDSEIKEKIAQIPENQRYLVTPHDAFNYFSRAYGMKVVAPQGVSTESEVSNVDIEKTADFIAKNKIKAIFAESTTNPDRMIKLQEVVKSKGFEVKVLSGEGKELFSDSLSGEGEKGSNYLEMYRHNVDLIVDNLK